MSSAKEIQFKDNSIAEKQRRINLVRGNTIKLDTMGQAAAAALPDK